MFEMFTCTANYMRVLPMILCSETCKLACFGCWVTIVVKIWGRVDVRLRV